ncbi:MAG TPA: sulfur carrier protein ThiS [Solimonas sp.]|nr:sulfur carrier protein ThiS [Solimonas sp.]
MNLIVNDQARSLPAPCSVRELLEQLGLGDRRVAVELNGEILPRSRHAGTALVDGDRVLVVQAIGGG